MAIDKVRTYPQVTTLAITCDKDSEKYNDYYIFSPDTPKTCYYDTFLHKYVIYGCYHGYVCRWQEG